MNSILAHAARNLLRAPRRTGLTVAAGAAGLAVAVVIANLARGVYDQAVGDAVRMGSGHLAVQRAGYLPRRDANLDFAAGDLPARIASLPAVAAVLPRLYHPGLAEGDAAGRAVAVVGVDPEAEAAVNPLARRVAAGAFLDGRAPYAALLPAALARGLGVRPGDALRLTASSGDGGQRSLEVRVAGVLDPGLDAVVPGAVYLPLPAAQELAGRPGRVHELAVLLRSGSPGAVRAAAGPVARLAGVRPGLAVLPWEATLPALRDAIALDAASHRFLLAAVYAIIGIGVVATLALSVLERTRELGLLLALGSPPSYLRRLVAAEAALLGVASVLAGLALGAAATAALARWGLDLRPLLRGEVAYGGALFSLRLHATWDGAEMARAAAALLAVHLLAAIGPAWRATTVRPAEAMRFR